MTRVPTPLKLIGIKEVKAGDLIYFKEQNSFLFASEVIEDNVNTVIVFDNPNFIEETYIPYMLNFPNNTKVLILNNTKDDK